MIRRKAALKRSTKRLKRTRIKRKPRPKTVGAQRPNARKYRNVDPLARAFMEWIKTKACVCCAIVSWRRFVEQNDHGILHVAGISIAAHIGGGMAAKASNWNILPLCEDHHDSNNPDCEHKLKKRFGAHWDIDAKLLMLKLREYFENENHRWLITIGDCDRRVEQLLEAKACQG